MIELNPKDITGSSGGQDDYMTPFTQKLHDTTIAFNSCGGLD